MNDSEKAKTFAAHLARIFTPNPSNIPIISEEINRESSYHEIKLPSNQVTMKSSYHEISQTDSLIGKVTKHEVVKTIRKIDQKKR